MDDIPTTFKLKNSLTILDNVTYISKIAAIELSNTNTTVIQLVKKIINTFTTEEKDIINNNNIKINSN